MNKINQDKPGLISKVFNLPAISQSRLPWVDYLKGIAIILVVYRHILIGMERSQLDIPEAYVNANMIFYSFRMPLFFILSGIFIRRSLLKRTFSKLISIKFENLIYPYLIWSFLQITMQIIFSKYTNSDRGWIDYTYILFQPRNLDQFWYLPALFNTTLIYLLVKKYTKASHTIQLIIGLSLYYLFPFFSSISMISDWMEFYIFFALGNALSDLFFRQNTQSFFQKPLLLISFIPLFIISQLFYLSQNEQFYVSDVLGKAEFLIISLTGCFTMFLVAFRFQKWNILFFLRVVGFYSLHIYVMHVFVAAFLRIIFTKFMGITNPAILLTSCISLSILIPIVFYNLLIKDNFLWFLFTYKKNKQIPETKLEAITVKTR